MRTGDGTIDARGVCRVGVNPLLSPVHSSILYSISKAVDKCIIVVNVNTVALLKLLMNF